MAQHIGQAYTFEDISLVPGYSEVLPYETDMSCQLSPRVFLPRGILLAAMDTVSDHKSAIAGGKVGVAATLHRNFTPEKQAAEIREVKRLGGALVVTNPEIIGIAGTVADALHKMDTNKISGLPVVVNEEEDRTVAGLITRADLRVLREGDSGDTSLLNYMTSLEDLVTAPVGTSEKEARRILAETKKSKLPLLNQKGEINGLITAKDLNNKLLNRLAARDSAGRLVVGVAVGIGTTPKAMEDIAMLIDAGADFISIDSSHGHSQKVIEATKAYSEAFGEEIDVYAGNVVTEAGADILFESGADVVKVGIGGGAICTTRMVAGAGIPQFTAIEWASRAAQKYGKNIISDGGTKVSGHLTKAYAGGASAVMLGRLVAGAEETPGEKKMIGGVLHTEYRGMAAIEAVLEGEGSRERYFLEDAPEITGFTPQGVAADIPVEGPMSAVIKKLADGVAVGMGLTGCRTIEELRDAQYVDMSEHGAAEGNFHSLDPSKVRG